VESRLAAIERLKRKHGPTLADVLRRQTALKDELSALESSDVRAAELDAREQQTREAFLTAARSLSSSRRAAAGKLSRALESAMAELAMPKSRVDVRIAADEANDQTWSSRGIDAVEFFVSPNPGEDVRPLARVASGGELSRIMLALRTLALPDEPGRTLIFDEVDAGIGGAAADAVGARLQALGEHAQVLCITHLPQIAARADTHYAITKTVTRGRTLTGLNRLDPAGREGEIARMIAGAEVTARVIASARDLLASRRRDETKAKDQRRRRS